MQLVAGSPMMLQQLRHHPSNLPFRTSTAAVGTARCWCPQHGQLAVPSSGL